MEYLVGFAFETGNGADAVRVVVSENCPTPATGSGYEPHYWRRGVCENCGRTTKAAQDNIEQAMRQRYGAPS